MFILGLIRGAIKKLSVKDLMDKVFTPEQKAELQEFIGNTAKAAAEAAVKGAIEGAMKK